MTNTNQSRLAPQPISDETLHAMRQQFTILNDEAIRLWKLKNKSAEDWYHAQVLADDLKKEIEREETCRAWFEQFQARAGQDNKAPAMDETAAPAVGEL
jgi:hypothetical protein